MSDLIPCPHSVALFRARSAYQCGEPIVGEWRETRSQAEQDAISWREPPVGAGHGYWIEEYDP